MFHAFRVFTAGLEPRIQGAAALVAALACLGSAEVSLTADNPAFNYYGRFDFSNPKAPRFNWSGTTIEFAVNGTATVSVGMADGAGYYDIEVDGKLQPTPVFANASSDKQYPVASGLSQDSHVIRVIRRNEPYPSVATFRGITLADGGKIVATPKPTRKMEFVGDSWTAGYFNEACVEQQKNTNTNKAWARLTSKAFHAQDIILAESGIGMAKSLGGKTVIPKKYPDTFDSVGSMPNPKWDFTSWKPDIVSIFLGINDKNAGATDAQFIAAIHAFVTTIRGNYPDAAILFMSATGNMDAAARNAVAAETTSLGHKRIYWHEVKPVVSGCQYHPTLAEDQTIANAAIARIVQITGWDTAQASDIRGSKRTPALFAGMRAAWSDARTVFLSAPPEAAGLTVLALAANGRVAARIRLDANGEARWNAGMGTGGFVIGSRETGWARLPVGREPDLQRIRHYRYF